MDGSFEPDALFNFETIDGLNVLNADGFHVLGSSAINVTCAKTPWLNGFYNFDFLATGLYHHFLL